MKNRILTLVAIFGVFAFSSCTKDKTEMTTEDAQNEISAVSQEMSTMVNGIKNGEAVNAIDDFLAMAKKSAFKNEDENWFDAMFTELDKQIDFDYLDSELHKERHFYYTNYLGRYTWNFTTETWDKSAANSIILEFPASKTSTSNNAVITIESYTDEILTIDGESAWLPKETHLTVEKDGTKIMGIDLNEANYSNSFPYVTKFDVSIFVAPVTERFKFEEKTKREIYASQTLSDASSSFGAEATLSLLQDLDENLDEEYFNTLVGQVFFNDLSAHFNVNLANIINYSDEITEAQVNEDLKVDFYLKDEKIGYLFAENEQFYIVYNNGDKELINEAFEDLITALENSFDSEEFVKSLPLKKKLALRKKVQRFEKTIKFIKTFKK